MTPGYKARREAKHDVQHAEKVANYLANPSDLQTIDLTLKIPRLSWQGGKTLKQRNGGRKKTPGHNTELNEALVENGSRTFSAQIKEIVEAGKALGVEPVCELPCPGPEHCDECADAEEPTLENGGLGEGL